LKVGGQIRSTRRRKKETRLASPLVVLVESPSVLSFSSLLHL
jgi:hypothetical protein